MGREGATGEPTFGETGKCMDQAGCAKNWGHHGRSATRCGMCTTDLCCCHPSCAYGAQHTGGVAVSADEEQEFRGGYESDARAVRLDADDEKAKTSVRAASIFHKGWSKICNRRLFKTLTTAREGEERSPNVSVELQRPPQDEADAFTEQTQGLLVKWNGGNDPGEIKVGLLQFGTVS